MAKKLNNKMEGKPKQKMGKSLKKSSNVLRNKKKKKMSMKIPTLNPMVFYPRFPHISEQIFDHLDIKSLENCREVSKSWQNSIDNRNLLWNKIIKDAGGNKAFQLACKNGVSKMAELVIQKSAKLEVDFNAQTPFKMSLKTYGLTPFQLACYNGHLEVAEILIQKSVELNVDLNTKGSIHKLHKHYLDKIEF